MRLAVFAFLWGALAAGCGSIDGAGGDKRPVEFLSLGQCNREMTALDQQVADMEARLSGNEPNIDLLEAAQEIRQQIPAVEMKCSASDESVKKLEKLDRDLANLIKRLEVESYR